MSFDVNVGRTEPIIKAAANTNNDGGSGGNLGYMMGGGRQKKKEDKGSLFDKSKNMSDSFELSSKKINKDIFDYPEEKSWLKGIIDKFKK